MEIKIINSPYYIGNGCDCCEGYWYDSYSIHVDGVRLESEDDHPWDGKEVLTFSYIEDVEEYLKNTYGEVGYELVQGDES